MWLDSDVEAALAWQEEQASLCPGCNHPLDETTAEDLDLIAEPVVCRRCRVTNRAAEQWQEDGGGPGVLWTVKTAPPLVPD